MAKKRNDNRYVKNFMYDGKRYYVYATKKSELDAKKAEKLAELQQGSGKRVNPTMNEYYDHFTEMREGVSGATLRSQANHFKRCSEVVMDGTGKTFGELKIKEVKQDDILIIRKSFLNDKKSTRTINDRIAHLNHVFNQAVIGGVIDKNPCMGLKSLKRTEQPASKTIHRALTKEETKKFFEAARERNSFYINAFTIMIKTGMRIGEVAALMLTDVDEKNSVIHVRRTVTRDEVGGYLIGETTKTEHSKRDIPVHDMEVFKAIKAQRNLNRMIFGSEEQTIFRSSENCLLREYTINREIARICKDVGIEKFTCHCFRHTFATRFIEQRPQDYKALSEILGHTTTDITLNLYTHVTDQRKTEAMQGIVIAI